MKMANVVTIMVVMGGIICSLIGIIYKLLSDRIKANLNKIVVVDKAYNIISISISSIKTDINWIKKKLDV